jgi:hypothetical protein
MGARFEDAYSGVIAARSKDEAGTTSPRGKGLETGGMRLEQEKK